MNQKLHIVTSITTGLGETQKVYRTPGLFVGYLVKSKVIYVPPQYYKYESKQVNLKVRRVLQELNKCTPLKKNYIKGLGYTDDEEGLEAIRVEGIVIDSLGGLRRTHNPELVGGLNSGKITIRDYEKNKKLYIKKKSEIIFIKGDRIWGNYI